MRPGVGAGCRRDLARCWPLLSRATDRGEDLHLSFNQILASGSCQINFPEASSPAKWEESVKRKWEEWVIVKNCFSRVKPYLRLRSAESLPSGLTCGKTDAKCKSVVDSWLPERRKTSLTPREKKNSPKTAFAVRWNKKGVAPTSDVWWLLFKGKYANVKDLFKTWENLKNTSRGFPGVLWDDPVPERGAMTTQAVTTMAFKVRTNPWLLMREQKSWLLRWDLTKF